MGIHRPPDGPLISREFFQRTPLLCARDLVGTVLHWGNCSGRVVETEAYDAEGDEACHTFFRPSTRVFVENHSAGDAYVYLNYGIHWMLNALVKGERTGFVLIRALEPLTGFDFMQQSRGLSMAEALCSGPGKLTQALGVTGRDHGRDLCSDPAYGFGLEKESFEIVPSPRIGIRRATEKLWRFYVSGNPHVSGSRMPLLQNKKRPGRG